MATGDFSVGDGAIGDSAALMPTVIDLAVATISVSGGVPVVNPIIILPFGALGDGSIGDDAIGGESTPLKNLTDVPSASISLAANAPTVIAGVLIDVPVAAVAVSAVTPTFLVGVTINAPVAVVSVVGAAPQIVVSANILVGTAAPIGLTAYYPESGAGASILVDSIIGQATGGAIGDDAIGDYAIGIGSPYFTAILGNPRISLRTYAPTLVSGVVIDVPIAAVAVTAFVPQILQSANILIPAAAMIAAYGNAPSVSGGSNFAVPASQTVNMFAIAPQFFPGSLVDINLMIIALTGSIPEIDSRSRRIGVHAIAS